MSDKQVKTKRVNGRWSKGVSGNPKGRPPLLPPEMRQRLDQVTPDLFEMIIERALNGDMHAAKLLLDRSAPAPKQTSPAVVIPELSEAKTLSERAHAVIEAVGNGICPPDIGSTLIQAIGATAKIIEIDEIERRLSALEAK